MFYFNEGSLDISPEWEDRSLVLLVHPSNLSISVSREVLPLGMTFSEYVADQFTQVSKQLKGYRETERGAAKISGCDVVISEFNWQSPEGRLYQISAIFDLPSRPIIITASSPKPLTEGQKTHLFNIIQSFKAR